MENGFTLSRGNGVCVTIPNSIIDLRKLLDDERNVIRLPKFYGKVHCRSMLDTIKNLYNGVGKRCIHNSIYLAKNIYPLSPYQILDRLEESYKLICEEWKEDNEKVVRFKADLCYGLAMLLSHYSQAHSDDISSNRLEKIVEFIWGCNRGLNIDCMVLDEWIQFELLKRITCVGITNMTQCNRMKNTKETNSLGEHSHNNTTNASVSNNNAFKLNEKRYYVFCRTCRRKFEVEPGSELERRVASSLQDNIPYRITKEVCTGPECMAKRNRIVRLANLNSVHRLVERRLQERNDMYRDMERQDYSLFQHRVVFNTDNMKDLLSTKRMLDGPTWTEVVVKSLKISGELSEESA